MIVQCATFLPKGQKCFLPKGQKFYQRVKVLPQGFTKGSKVTKNYLTGWISKYRERVPDRISSSVSGSRSKAFWDIRFQLIQRIQRTSINVEHDPVSETQSNRILHFRTGSGLDCILKNSTGSDMDIQTALTTAVKCLIRVFFQI